MPGVTSYLKIAVSTRNWLAGTVCIGGGRMLWEVDVDRYDTDSLPLSSMGRFIARMGGAGGGRGGRLGAVCSWHAPIRGQGQQNASWPRRGAREGGGACTYHVLIVSGSHLLPHSSSNARSHYLHFLGLDLSSWPLYRLCGGHGHCVWKPRRRLSVSPSPGPGCSPIGICGVTGVFRRMHLSLAYKLLECVSDQK